MDLEAWAWLIVALILLAAEVLSPGLIMLPFGLGALAALGASLASDANGWQWIAFFGVSSVAMIVFQRFVVRRTRD